jgi:hypothetical protein
MMFRIGDIVKPVSDVHGEEGTHAVVVYSGRADDVTKVFYRNPKVGHYTGWYANTELRLVRCDGYEMLDKDLSK